MSKLFIVTGPPCSGKSKYVEEHIQDNDICFDYDRMFQAQTYQEAHAEASKGQRNMLVFERETLIKAAAKNDCDNVYVIASKLSSVEMYLDNIDYEEVEIKATKEECLERLEQDDNRPNKEAEKEKILKWFGEKEGRKMPVKETREYRSTAKLQQNEEEYIVEGYATTFNDPYVLYNWEGNDYFEQIDSKAFDDADMSDVILQYDHEGKVFARQKNGTLQLSVDSHGLKVRADLSKSEGARQLYEEIKSGLISEMSFAFTVSEDAYNNDTRTRTITKIKKVYDVSAVSIPANPSTEISARNYVNGLVELERQEKAKAEARTKQQQRIRILLEVSK